MDILLLTAPAQDPWCYRSKLAIEKAMEQELKIRAAIPENLDRIVAPDWVNTKRNREGFLFIAPTQTGAAQHFLKKYRVAHFLEREKPFGGGIIEAVAHWFDDQFSPKSHMNSRLDETCIPGACLGNGTKWREAACLFERWNQSGRYNYISALLVHLLDPEQWPGGGELRAQAWSEIEQIFRSAGLRLHENGYLIPALEEEAPEPATVVWDDEPRFRRELVEPLLRRIPGVINVVYTHGKDEYGRDFIFDYRHPLLGDRRWVAVQVKTGDVSGTAGGHLRTILDQVQMAFEHTVIDLGAMGKVATSEVIVLISGQFTNNAKERILDGIRDPVWRANTFFLDRTAIEGMIRSTKRTSTV